MTSGECDPRTRESETLHAHPRMLISFEVEVQVVELLINRLFIAIDYALQ